MTEHSDLSEINQPSKRDEVQLIAPEYAKYLSAFMSENTRIAYKSDLKQFIDWGGTVPCSPHMLCMYLSVHADRLSVATLSRHLVSINWAHKSKNLLSPTNSPVVKATLRGIKRLKGTEQRQVSPVLKNNLIDMVEGLDGFKGCRDKALLLVGFAGAFRRSELVSIRYEDIEFVEQGMVVHVRKSKTDQYGEGRKIAIPYARGRVCPVLSLKNWLELSAIVEGYIFRPINRHGNIGNTMLSTQAVAVIVKCRAHEIGLEARNFSGHSLRTGLVTSAAQAGVSLWKIRQQTGHKSDAMLSRYIRDANIFIDNAAGIIF